MERIELNYNTVGHVLHHQQRKIERKEKSEQPWNSVIRYTDHMWTYILVYHELSYDSWLE